MQFDFKMIKSRLTSRIEKEFRYKNVERWENIAINNSNISRGTLFSFVGVEVAEHMRTLVEKIDYFIEGLCITESVNDDNFEYTFCVVESGYIISKRSGAGILHEVIHSQKFYVSRRMFDFFRLDGFDIHVEIENVMADSLLDLWLHLEGEQLCLLDPGWVIGKKKDGKVNMVWYLPCTRTFTCNARVG